MEKMVIEFDPVTEEYTIVDGDHNLYSGLELIKIGADIVQEYVTCKKTDGCIDEYCIRFRRILS